MVKNCPNISCAVFSQVRAGPDYAQRRQHVMTAPGHLLGTLAFVGMARWVARVLVKKMQAFNGSTGTSWFMVFPTTFRIAGSSNVSDEWIDHHKDKDAIMWDVNHQIPHEIPLCSLFWTAGFLWPKPGY